MAAAPTGGPAQQARLLRLRDRYKGDAEAPTVYLLQTWRSLGLPERSYKVAYAGLARQERGRYGDMLGEADRERLALADELSDPGPARRWRFAKLGIIPATGCPQTCRHCMSIWRPLKPTDPEPQKI